MYNKKLQGRQDSLLCFTLFQKEHSASEDTDWAAIGSEELLRYNAQPPDGFTQRGSRSGFARTRASFHHHGLKRAPFS